MLRCGACLAALALGAVLASPAFADEVEDFMKKADEARYTPAKNGLKDLKVDMDTGDPMMASFKIALYWKAPDKKACKVEGGEGPMAGMAGMLQDRMKALISVYLVPESYSEKRDTMTYELTQDGELMKLVGTPKPGTPEAEQVKSATTWFDSRFLAVKMSTETSMGSTTMEATYTEKDGKFLIDTMGGQMGPQAMNVSFTYLQVDGIWLTETVTQEAMGRQVVSTFKGHQVNKGLDDALFESPAKDEEK